MIINVPLWAAVAGGLTIFFAGSAASRWLLRRSWRRLASWMRFHELPPGMVARAIAHVRKVFARETAACAADAAEVKRGWAARNVVGEHTAKAAALRLVTPPAGVPVLGEPAAPAPDSQAYYTAPIQLPPRPIEHGPRLTAVTRYGDEVPAGVASMQAIADEDTGTIVGLRTGYHAAVAAWNAARSAR